MGSCLISKPPMPLRIPGPAGIAKKLEVHLRAGIVLLPPAAYQPPRMQLSTCTSFTAWHCLRRTPFTLSASRLRNASEWQGEREYRVIRDRRPQHAGLSCRVYVSLLLEPCSVYADARSPRAQAAWCNYFTAEILPGSRGIMPCLCCSAERALDCRV